MKNFKIMLLFISIHLSLFAQNVRLDNTLYSNYYNIQLKQCLYTYHVLHPRTTAPVYGRTGIVKDTRLLRRQQPSYVDYRNDFVYDAGHLVPCIDFDAVGENQFFINIWTNILPMHYKLNRGQWRYLELYIHNLNVINNFEIQVWTGQDVGYRLMGKQKIPINLWKLIKVNNSYYAWLFPNRDLGNVSFQSFAVNPVNLINKINAIGMQVIE